MENQSDTLPENTAPQQVLMVWWIIWGALQTGIFVIYHFLGSSPDAPKPSEVDSPIWLASLIPLAISTIIRWAVLPRFTSAVAALPFFILGIALAENLCFLGIFFFPEHKLNLMILSATGVFQFIPVFARRYFHPDLQRSNLK